MYASLTTGSSPLSAQFSTHLPPSAGGAAEVSPARKRWEKSTRNAPTARAASPARVFVCVLAPLRNSAYPYFPE